MAAKKSKKAATKKTVKKAAPKKAAPKKNAPAAVSPSPPVVVPPGVGNPCICRRQSGSWWCMKKQGTKLVLCDGPFDSKEECEASVCVN